MTSGDALFCRTRNPVMWRTSHIATAVQCRRQCHAVPPPETVDVATIGAVHDILVSGEPAMLLLAGASLRADALAQARRIADATGARLSAETFNTRIERGGGRPPVDRAPYPIDQALEHFAGVRHLILVSAVEPVAFFAYPGRPGRLLPRDCTVHVLARPEDDGPDALARLAAGPRSRRIETAAPPPPPARGAVTSEALAQSLTALLPENAVVVDEALTFGFALYPGTANAAPHDWLQLTGGAIGDGLPMATGAALGAPGRRVICLQADGSALYTVQALWTQARERLDVTTVILSNRRYEILVGELAGVGAEGGRASGQLFSLGDPAMDWVKIAEGFGVEAARADTMERFADLFTAANARKGPFLIELAIP